MKTIKATLTEKQQVFELLDEFYITCLGITSPGKKSTRKSCRILSNNFYDEIISQSSTAIFLIEVNKVYAGIITVHKIPQLRKGIFVAEIEEMFVRDEFQGKGVAQELLTVAENWARENGMKNIRLESDRRLLRAHAFYEKQGFEDYGKAYMKNLLI